MPEQKPELFKQLNNLLMLDQDSLVKQVSLAFYNHLCRIGLYRDSWKLAGYYHGWSNVYQLARLNGKVVLDVGCGFGLPGIILAGLGAQMVYGIDISEAAITSCKRILEQFPDLDNIQFNLGDGMKIDYPDGFFEAVVANDVFSHLLDLDLLLGQIKRVLRPGGLFYIYESNNIFELRHKLAMRRYRRMVELGPVEPGLGLPKPFRQIRREMIQQRYPALGDQQLDYLAGATQGLWGEQLLQAAEEYLTKGKLSRTKGLAYVDPRHGARAEFEFNPFSLIGRLKRYGFRARIIPPYVCYTYPYLASPLAKNGMGQIIKALSKRIIRFAYPFSFLTTPQFEILARKE